MEDFQGKVAIVTGGASGIGAAIVRQLAGAGARVVIADFNDAGAHALEDELGAHTRSFKVDVADSGSVEKMVAFTIETFSSLQLLVNNAGISVAPAKTAELPIEDWDRIIAVNQSSVFYGMKHAIPALLASGGGAIVNMASILGAVGWEGSIGYVASKHAIVGMTKSAAIEYAADGIRVNAIGPAFISTPLIENGMSDDERNGLVALHPIGRLGQPDEVAALASFLLSDRASFITGSYHPVDGGYLSR